MNNEKDKPPSRLALRKYLIIGLFALILAALINVKLPHDPGRYKVGDIARETVRSPSTFVLPGTDIEMKKGEVIVREGQKVGPDDVRKLAGLRETEKNRSPVTLKMLFLFLIFFSFIAIVFEFADRNIKKFNLSEKDLIFSASLTTFTIFLVKLSLTLFDRFVPDYGSLLFYAFPLFLFGIVMRVVLFSEAVLVFSTILAVAVTLTVENGISIFTYAFLGNLVASYFSGQVENRTTMLGAGFFSALVMSFVMFLFHVLLGYPLGDVPFKITLILLGGMASSSGDRRSSAGHRACLRLHDQFQAPRAGKSGAPFA